MEPLLARKMHGTMEAYHGIVYFAPEPAERYERLGLEGRSGYFASRSAAMGPVATDVIVATFFNFHPGLVHHAMRGVWARTTPEAVSAARLDGIDAALRRLIGAEVDSAEMVEAAALAREAATDLPSAGRPLYAAHAALDWPDEPHLVLWHAQTLVREFRGDGHIACLLASGIRSGCEALVQHASTGEIGADVLRSSRSWSEAEWADAVESLRERGWVDADGVATIEGRDVREKVETDTDELALAPWRRLGQERSDHLRALVRPFSRAVVAGGDLGRGL